MVVQESHIGPVRSTMVLEQARGMAAWVNSLMQAILGHGDEGPSGTLHEQKLLISTGKRHPHYIIIN